MKPVGHTKPSHLAWNDCFCVIPTLSLLMHLPPANDTTGDFFACIPRRLGTKIIRITMDHYSLSDDVTDAETPSPHRKKHLSVTGQ